MGAPALVSALNSDVLPLCGSPIIPIVSAIVVPLLDFFQFFSDIPFSLAAFGGTRGKKRFSGTHEPRQSALPSALLIL